MKARFAYRASLGVALFFGFCNAVVAVRVFLLARSPVHYDVRVVQPPAPPFFSSLTNFPLSVSSVHALSDASNIVSTASTFSPGREVAALDYHYFSVGGRPHIRLHDAYYIIGDATAYGVIDLIFPERVYLRGGDWISNTYPKFAKKQTYKEDNTHEQHRSIDTRFE